MHLNGKRSSYKQKSHFRATEQWGKVHRPDELASNGNGVMLPTNLKVLKMRSAVSMCIIEDANRKCFQVNDTALESAGTFVSFCVCVYFTCTILCHTWFYVSHVHCSS
jgi:hypothetical protein